MSDNSSKPSAVAPKSRRKRLLQNLTLSVAVFLLCLLVCEIVLRFMGYGNLEIYDADPKLYWRLKPGQDCFTKVDRKPVHINAQGTRGPEFTVAKPAGTFRVLSLGDSRTFGWGLTDEETYSRRLETLLNALPAKTKRVEVINAGVNAWSFSQMAVYLREFGLRYQPDVVVLGEANLWTQFSEKNSPEFVRKFLWRVRLKNFLRRFALYHYVVETKLRDYYERNRTRFIPVDPASDTLFKAQQQSDPDAVFRSEIADICRTAQSNHIKPILLFMPRLDELNSTNQSRVLTIKQQIGKELGVSVCDVSSGLGDKNGLYLEADPVHYNARGNAIVAQKLFETVTNVISP
jgi:lysophospholipase L1-like esterase